MTGAFAGRDGHEVDALVTDRYLEALLAAHARGADRGPSPTTPDDPVRRGVWRRSPRGWGRRLPQVAPTGSAGSARSGPTTTRSEGSMPQRGTAVRC